MSDKFFDELSWMFTETIPFRNSNRGFARLDYDEAAALYVLVKSLHDPIGIEVGRWNGGSTILLAAAIGNGSLKSIDRKPKNDAKLKGLLPSNKVELIVGNSPDVLASLELESSDFLFIDGDHTYQGVKADFDNGLPLVKHGGYIIFHDMAVTRATSTQDPGVLQLGKELLDRPEIKLIYEVGSMSFWIKK